MIISLTSQIHNYPCSLKTNLKFLYAIFRDQEVFEVKFFFNNQPSTLFEFALYEN